VFSVCIDFTSSLPGLTWQSIIEVKASHLSLISQPQVIARLILEAAGREA